ncbi:hypothetical protein [Thaumasiovibrio sp. DFM-14]|uniref:hypothetical protein n=1 Tax=Thaumasiovibrio sp. DFM-14 TaxID=3384792 RepID=UPI00399FE4F0
MDDIISVIRKRVPEGAEVSVEEVVREGEGINIKVLINNQDSSSDTLLVSLG